MSAMTLALIAHALIVAAFAWSIGQASAYLITDRDGIFADVTNSVEMWAHSKGHRRLAYFMTCTVCTGMWGAIVGGIAATLWPLPAAVAAGVGLIARYPLPERTPS